jgi:hypothetical protein
LLLAGLPTRKAIPARNQSIFWAPEILPVSEGLFPAIEALVNRLAPFDPHFPAELAKISAQFDIEFLGAAPRGNTSRNPPRPLAQYLL